MMEILITAALSALLTLVVVAAWAHFYFQPRLKRALQQELDEQSQRAARVIADSVEEAVKRGLVDGVRALPTREMLEQTSRSLARSSGEIVGDRLGRFFGKKDR
tara:strand:+ start:12873 stop:13184 length:312 start_codon:yes stop_codon:yes gene_type:complete